MSSYHISRNGTLGRCSAKIKCPLGGSHFSQEALNRIVTGAPANAKEADISLRLRGGNLHLESELLVNPKEARRIASLAKRLGEKKSRVRSNTTASETLFVDYITAVNRGDELSAIEAAQKLDRLPFEQRFNLTKTTDLKQNRKVVENCISAIRQESGLDKIDLTSDRNNRIGSDLEEKTSGTSFELKFGMATDLNVGVRGLNNLFENESIDSYLPSAEDRQRWRKMYAEGKKDEQFKEYIAKLKEAETKLNLQKKTPLTPEIQNLLNSYYDGVTSSEEIAKNFESGKENRKVVRLELQKDLTWKKSERQPLEKKDGWSFNRSYVSPNNRLHLIFHNENGAELDFIYNHKNDHKFPDGTRAPAKNGLSSPNWNGWFKGFKGANKTAAAAS